MDFLTPNWGRPGCIANVGRDVKWESKNNNVVWAGTTVRRYLNRFFCNYQRSPRGEMVTQKSI